MSHEWLCVVALYKIEQINHVVQLLYMSDGTYALQSALAGSPVFCAKPKNFFFARFTLCAKTYFDLVEDMFEKICCMS